MSSERDQPNHQVESGSTGPDPLAPLGELSILPVPGLPEVEPGDDLVSMVMEACLDTHGLVHHDVLVVSQKVISKAEGQLVTVDPDDPLAHKPLVIEEASRILRRRGDLIITETKHGFVCANAGIDRSNVAPDIAALLPEDSDRSARRLRDAIGGQLGTDVGVIVADTFGRPWRRGLTDIALGSAGLVPVLDLRGSTDALGKELHVTEVCIVDQLAGAAELVRGKSTGTAVAIVRGGPDHWFGAGSVVDDVVRSPSEDLFR